MIELASLYLVRTADSESDGRQKGNLRGGPRGLRAPDCMLLRGRKPVGGGRTWV